MPKQVLTLNDFSGGLVTDTSPRALEDNQLSECTNFDVSDKGKVKTSRVFKSDSTYGDQDSRGTEADSGYGLFAFSNDKLISNAATTNIGEFIISTDGTTVDALEVTATGTNTDAWQGDILGSNDNGIRPAFYAAEGDLFVGGTSAASPPVFATPASLVYHDQTQIPSASSSIHTAAWVAGTQAKSAPNDGGGTIANAEMIIYETDGANTDYNGADAGDLPLGQDDIHWIIRPSSATGGSGAEGNWTNDHDGTDFYEYAATWLYKGWNPLTGTDSAESDMTILQNHSNDSTTGNPGAGMYGATSFDDKAVQVRAYCNNNTPLTATSVARYGARLYTRLASSSGDWYLLAEVSYEKGIKGDLESDWNPWFDAEDGNGEDHTKWSHPDTGDACTTGDIVSPPATLTFKTLNGFSPEDIPDSDLSDPKDRLVKFKTGVVANSRAYIGNVELNGRTYGDKILKSPLFQYDTFTESNYIDVALNDGDQITALAAYGGRLLNFKNNSVYVINISKEVESVETEQEGAGVEMPGAVVTTSFGVVWVNTNGCYHYDGESINQLQLGKLSIADWDNVTIRATIGYDAKHKQIIVLWDSNNGANAFVYTADTGNWHKVSDIVNATTNTTNMINVRGDQLLVGGGAAIDDINFLADRTAAAGSAIFSLKTKVFDFGNPESKKNLLEVAVVYKYGHADLDINISTDDGASFTEVGGLTDTDSAIDTVEFNMSTTSAFQNKKTFQIQIEGDCHQSFELYSIALTYRDLGVH